MTQERLVVNQIFAGNSEMAMLMRSHDWSQTALGSPEQWSQSLKTAVRITLTSRQPMFVWWGKELINLYNDAYRTHLRSIAVTVRLVQYGFQSFCHYRPMISGLVAIELCETACLSALFFKKRSQMGSIWSLWVGAMEF